MPIQPIWPIFVVNRLNWQCCLAGSSKTVPRILIFSIAMGANYSWEPISIVPNLLDIIKFSQAVWTVLTRKQMTGHMLMHCDILHHETTFIYYYSMAFYCILKIDHRTFFLSYQIATNIFKTCPYNLILDKAGNSSLCKEMTFTFFI